MIQDVSSKGLLEETIIIADELVIKHPGELKTSANCDDNRF